MPSNEYIRCHYSAPTGQECEIWFPKSSKSDILCPIHKSSLSASLVANGHGREEFFEHRDRVIEPLITATANMTDSEACSYYDQHIADLEQQIEKLKLEAMHARALKQGKFENLTEDERKRRKIRVSSPTTKVKKSTGKLSNMTPARAIAEMMSKYSMTKAFAITQLGFNLELLKSHFKMSEEDAIELLKVD